MNTILDLMEKLPDMKTAGLNALGEFIEDCEFPQLSKRAACPGSEAPPQATLGDTSVTSSTVSFLRCHQFVLQLCRPGQAGGRCQALRPQIRILLDRCQLDDDDEVRDRATMFVAVLTRR